ncbi:GNAT family N-acetyltransferase [Flavobacterium adhaerens]|uniref:GNAT family N-acetyltransferase n=1 Tax=Flavobacterium adhaerens TaxID=3149043 RepID=UPI0032B4566C
MKTTLSYQIYETAKQLPENWDDLGYKNIFLSKEYFEILDQSAPKNMICHYIGLFQEQNLVGIAIAQFLNLNKLESFGDRDRCIKTTTRKFILKKFASHVLVIGNNMLTGQNSFQFSESISPSDGVIALRQAANDLKLKFKSIGKKIHITTFKDYNETEIQYFNKDSFSKDYKYCVQPNMIFDIPSRWKTEQDYIDSLIKKYRDQYKRARKKAEGIEKKKFHLEDIIKYEKSIYELYHHVAQNAPFNTFFLTQNHFRVFKEILKDKFLFYGYFLDGKLIGFNTLIKNGDVIDTYFLGYDESLQKEKMLYLNMLYDMVAYSINKGFKAIIFARTALEIKSSVGAKPFQMYGYMNHSNSQINKQVPKIFPKLEPEVVWQERNPFKG